MKMQLLRDLIEQRMVGPWDQWAERHPQLAQAMDRTRLVELSIMRLRDDPQFAEALQQAGVDEAGLRAAAQVIGLVDAVVSRLLPY